MADYSPSAFSLARIGGAALQNQQTDAILACNEKTAAHGLLLTPQQAEALAITQADTLQKTGRIEFGGGVAQKLILAFCDSPFLLPDEYEDTLHALIELFYSFKNETCDRIGDDALIACMRAEFDGACRGSLDLLVSSALPALARRVKARRTAPEAAE